MRRPFAGPTVCVMLICAQAWAQAPDGAPPRRAAALEELQQKLAREKAEAQEAGRSAAAARQADMAALSHHARAAPPE